jgi:Tol biopolymer transport system component
MVSDVLDRLLAKDPSRRYQHAGDLRLDLLRAVDRLTLPTPQATPPPADADAAPTVRRTVLAAAAALILAAGLAGGVAIGRVNRRAPEGGRDLAAIALEQLTSDPGYEGEPTFSPDGESLAYVSDRSGNLEIYLKQVAGGPDINLTNDPGDDVQPAFSPDGKQIAFVSDRGGASGLVYRNPRAPLMGGDVWVMAAFGGSPRRVARKGNFPGWTPDGSSLVFTAGPWQNQRVYIVSAQGGTPREIPLQLPRRELFLFHPSISPDGRWLLLEGQEERVYLAPAAGGEARDVIAGRRPSWNAYGTAILVSSAAPGHNLSLFELPFTPDTGAIAKPRPLTLGRGTDTDATASRDGRRVAFAARDITFNVERIALDGNGIARGDAEAVTAGTNVSYLFDVAHDGSVVHQSRRGSTYQIWRSAPGSPAVQLTSDPRFSCRFPRISPDGSTIAFDREALAEGRHEVAAMELDGGNPRALFEGSGMFIEWHPSGTELAYFTAAEQVHLRNLVTGVSKPLTKERVRSGQTFSADGEWLVYQALGPDDSTDVHAVPIRGGDPRVVAAGPHEDFHPQMSRDDRWLYFQHDHKNVLRVPGPAQGWRQAEPEAVTAFPESNLYLEDPQLSPDGRWLYFSRGRFTSDLWVITLPPSRP